MRREVRQARTAPVRGVLISPVYFDGARKKKAVERR